MSSFVDVAIVGAGPYGLSLAAHLADCGISHRVIGRPMHAWQNFMVAGMFLKSDGPSSNLSAPVGQATLEQFCRGAAIDYRQRVPVLRETFINYGLDFQKRFVSELTPQNVEMIDGGPDNYMLRLSDGEIIKALRVVIAVGVQPFNHIPDTLAALGPELVSHSSQFGAVDHMKGRDVAVIGAGASATDVAYALHRAGARPTIVSRRTRIAFQSTPEPQTLLQKIRHPDSGIGGGWRLKVCADAPSIVRSLPLKLRQRIVRNYLGAAPGWFMRERVEGTIPLATSTDIVAASRDGERARLQLRNAAGEDYDMAVDHVVAATGYRVAVDRLAFLAPALAGAVKNLDGAPILSRSFETSLNGLYFMGPAAALGFGPVMRFVYGADFAVRQLSRDLHRRLPRRTVRASHPANLSPSALGG